MEIAFDTALRSYRGMILVDSEDFFVWGMICWSVSGRRVGGMGLFFIRYGNFWRETREVNEFLREGAFLFLKKE